jgi:hypothetical protein
MARPRNGSTLTIAELEEILDSRRRKLSDLEKERTRQQKRLDELDREIRSLSGGRGGRRGGGRAKNGMSLVATLESVLRSAGKPLGVGEILEKVEATGYHSNAANFRALINQTLIKEKQFTAADRGVYQMKK